MQTEILSMSRKEVDKLIVIEQVLAKGLSQICGARQLGITTRQLRRLIARHKQHGAEGLISKRRGMPSNNRVSDVVRSEVIGLIQSNYHDFGPTLAHEKLTEVHGVCISRESVRQLMMGAGIWKGKARKRARPVQQMRERRPCFGELVQIDGSPHEWFEDRGPHCCLIVFIDDATSKIITLRFVEVECTQGYFDCIADHLAQYGRPLAYYSDRHGIFRVNLPEAKSSTGYTQVSRACEELGIELICANSPQAKGRVERANGILQDRLIKELRLAKIDTIEAANAYLPTFIKQYNKRFGKEAQLPQDAHRQTQPDDQTLKQILSHQSTRKISKQLQISYLNVIYQIQTNSPSYNMRGANVTVCESNGQITLLYKNKPLQYKIFDKHNQPTKVIDTKNLDNHIKKVKKHKPASDHPWRKKYPNAKDHHAA